ncbi:MAG: ATP-dependent RNA helicase HrpA [Phycisphaerales bacterium]
MTRDVRRFRNRLRGGKGRRRSMKKGERHTPQPLSEAVLAKIEADIERSIQRRLERERNIPQPTYPEDLPVVQRREDIKRAIEAHQVVIVAGETGSGKTTQLPKICLELGRGARGMIGHTQPRRVAARALSARIAQELHTTVGKAVGTKVRFHDKTSDETYIKVMTDGILLAETQGDHTLDAYDTIIIDEAHERSLNIDFLLGYLKRLLPRRPDLKVIVTSATIDTERFSEHFNGAPIVEVSGRTYPVEVRYRPLRHDDPDTDDLDQITGILHAVDELARDDRASRTSPGDVLVFLPGEREIRETAEALRKHHPPGVEILPLYARLSAEEQMRVFTRSRTRRIVLATNVAETSLTVPGITGVVDPGTARINRYNPRARVQRLEVEAISRASADQRAGRCGRIAPGTCIRLYSEEEYLARDAFTDPEIRRTDLASVILRMKALRLGDVDRFPFVEPPDRRAIREGLETLRELGAVDDADNLTSTGRALAALPIDPRIGRMLLAAEKEDALEEVLIIAGALSTQDPRIRPHEEREKADTAHAAFDDEASDFVSFLNLWGWFFESKKELSNRKLREACAERYISYIRMREWIDVVSQLRRLLTEMGHKTSTQPAMHDQLHRALLAGLITNVGFLKDPHEYTGARGVKFSIFPGSGLFKKKPKWVVSAELVRTTRLYARTVAKIDPRWIEEVAPHLVKKVHTDPRWVRAKARIMANEKVSFQGLEIVAGRAVHYGPIDPARARELFIHHALVEGDYPRSHPFLAHNKSMVEGIRRLEAKGRRRDLLADEESVWRFFDAKLPPDVFNGSRFEGWRKIAEREDPRVLFLREEDLLQGDPEDLTQDRFPDRIDVQGEGLRLDYAFEPGAEGDGVTMTVPLEALGKVDRRSAEWLVPGLLHDKATALIKTLPKQARRSLVPAPDVAQEAVALMPFGRGDLLEELAKRLSKISATEVSASWFDPTQLPNHLRMRFRVVDAHGATLGEGRDIGALQRSLGVAVEQRMAGVEGSQYHRDGLTSWDFDELPERVELDDGERTYIGFPALIDRGEAVDLRLLADPHAASNANRAGQRRLAVLEMGGPIADLVRHRAAVDRMAVWFSPVGDGETLRAQLVDLIVDRACFSDERLARSYEAFDRRLDDGWNRLSTMVEPVCDLVAQVLESYNRVQVAINEQLPDAWAPALSDIRDQVDRLVYPTFLTGTPYRSLQQYPRYLRACLVRLEKLRGGAPAVEKDAQRMRDCAIAWNAYAQRKARHDEEAIADPELEKFRWMIEEFRVSLYAQELGTSMKVSAQRLQKQFEKCAL